MRRTGRLGNGQPPHLKVSRYCQVRRRFIKIALVLRKCLNRNDRLERIDVRHDALKLNAVTANSQVAMVPDGDISIVRHRSDGMNLCVEGFT